MTCISVVVSTLLEVLSFQSPLYYFWIYATQQLFVPVLLLTALLFSLVVVICSTIVKYLIVQLMTKERDTADAILQTPPVYEWNVGKVGVVQMWCR